MPAQARDPGTLLDPLATKLLAGEFKPGDKIKVTAKDDELVFKAGMAGFSLFSLILGHRPRRLAASDKGGNVNVCILSTVFLFSERRSASLRQVSRQRTGDRQANSIRRRRRKAIHELCGADRGDGAGE